MGEVNPATIKLPPELEGRQFFTPEEFGRLVGKSAPTIHRWRRAGFLRMRKFCPRSYMVPLSELERYMRGEMMETESTDSDVNF
jgi:hypothetical protein